MGRYTYFCTPLLSSLTRVFLTLYLLLAEFVSVDGFCKGMVQCHVFVCILSREALNHPTNKRHNFSELTNDSACDNMLLEFRLALELHERKMIDKIYPIFVGDATLGANGNIIYSHYFDSGCHPTLIDDIIVASVEKKVLSHLDKQGLGSPLLEPTSVAKIVEAITSNHGCYVDGSFFVALEQLIRDIREMLLFDIFLSYRVASDSKYVEILYYALSEEGYKVYWDKECLQPGVDWEVGFCYGLINSRIFVCLLSRGAINHATNNRQNIAALKEDSPCDNVLLEHRLALELRQRGMIQKIYPVFIGDSSISSNGEEIFTNYFGSGCHPNLSTVQNVMVTSIEEKLSDHLKTQKLGGAVTSAMSIGTIMKEITANQGMTST